MRDTFTNTEADAGRFAYEGGSEGPTLAEIEADEHTPSGPVQPGGDLWLAPHPNGTRVSHTAQGEVPGGTATIVRHEFVRGAGARSGFTLVYTVDVDPEHVPERLRSGGTRWQWPHSAITVAP